MPPSDAFRKGNLEPRATAIKSGSIAPMRPDFRHEHIIFFAKEGRHPPYGGLNRYLSG